MADRIDRTERLLNLVVALLGTRRAISRAQIRESVPGYADASSDTAFERMFERDKDELRSMGIPIETVFDDSGEVLGYRVQQDRFGYVDVRFSGAEYQVLGVAARAWEQAALGPHARRALLKLRPMAAEDEADTAIVFSAHLTATESALLPLMRAIRQSVRVRFPYTAAGSGEPVARDVEPWGVVCRAGNWYLIGFDCARAAPRTFRLSRIAGACAVLEERSVQARPSRDEVGRLLDSMLSSRTDAQDTVTARIVVHRPHGAELMRRADHVIERPDGTDEVWVTDTPAMVVSAVVRSLPHVEILEPPALARDVRRHLEAVVAAHGGLA